MTELQKVREQFKGCSEAWKWVEKNGFETIEQAWNACERGDWMLWMAGKTGLVTRQELTLAACQCARLSLKFVPSGEDRPRIAIEAAESWARGEIDIEEVKLAAYAASVSYVAYAAAAAYAAAYAAAAAYTAAYAAYAVSAVSAASAAASAAAYAADAAHAAHAAAAADAADAAYAAYAVSAFSAAYAFSAFSAVSAVSAAADGGAKKSTLKQCADLIRHLYKGQII